MAPGSVNLVNVEGVRLAYGTRVLLDGVSLGVADGDRIGVVGRNGSGKSRCSRCWPGDAHRTAGGSRTPATCVSGSCAQGDDVDAHATVRAAVVGDRPDHTWRDGRDRAVGGRHAAGRDRPGRAGRPAVRGERRRVALAAVLVDDPGLLLLDEPTNHLDVDAVAWLAGHLAARRGALVAVTHDRWFLDAVAERTWEVVDGAVEAYDGGYSAYVLAKAERLRLASAAEDRRRNLVRKELAWLRRGPPARTSKPRFRIDAANALIADEPPPRDSVELVATAGRRLGRSVYDVESVTVRLGDRDLLRDVTWRLGPGDRVGVVGANGAGKTTLLRLLAGEVTPTAGHVRVGRTVRPGYLSQTVAELPDELTALAAVEDVRPVVELDRGRELTARQVAERLGLTGERLVTRVGDLSGGERRRLQLVRLLMAGPNVLLLDEPTNDVDVETLTALEDLLDGWVGSLVVVSHDRYVLERVCDRMVGLLGDGAVRDLPGGVDEYLRLRPRPRGRRRRARRARGPGRGRGPRPPTPPARGRRARTWPASSAAWAGWLSSGRRSSSTSPSMRPTTCASASSTRGCARCSPRSPRSRTSG